MAALEITSLFAQPFQVAANLTATAYDSHSPSGRTVTVAAGWYRTFLAQPAWTGATKHTPKELLTALQTALNTAPGGTYWTVALRPDGAVRIAYPGGTGGAALEWDDVALRHLFGFTANVSIGSPGGSQDGAKQPTHCVFSHNARRNSTGRVPVPRRSAIGQTQDGLQYAMVAGKAGAKITADLGTHPFDSTAKAAMPENPSTVLWPDDAARWQTPRLAPHADLTPPWSLVDFFHTVHGYTIGAALGDYQAHVAGSAAVFYDVTVDGQTLQREDAVAPTVPHFAQLIDWRQVVLRFVAKRSRT